jgi:hypothetical protein
MKRTELAKLKGKKIDMGIEKAPAGRPVNGAPVDRREQRRRDQALGLVPLAVKVDRELVGKLQALAQERGTGLNDIVGELLTRGLKAK